MVDVHHHPPETLDEVLVTGLTARAAILSTLQALAATAVVTGALIALTAPSTGPSFVLLSKVPGWPEAWGSVLAVLGVAQLVAIRRRSYGAGAVISGGVALWYLALAAAFALQWWSWARGPRDTPDPPVYAVAVYCGLCGLHVIVADLLLRTWLRRRGS